MSLFKYICDVPFDLHDCLIHEAEILLSNPKNKKRFYRVFGNSLSKQYPVSKYSVTDYKQDSIDRINPVLNWINQLYPGHSFFQIQINSMDPNQIYPVHVDTLSFHQHATRLHIGIKNNKDCEYLEFVKASGSWEKKTCYIENFKLYEFNNNCPHSVHNKNNSFRINIVIDVIDKTLLASRDDWKDLDMQEFWRMASIENEFVNIPEFYKYTLKAFKDHLVKNKNQHNT